MGDNDTVVVVILSVVLVAIVLALVALLLYALNLRQVVRRVDRMRWSVYGSPPSRTDANQFVRAYAIVTDPGATQQLVRSSIPLSLREPLLMVCGAGSAAGSTITRQTARHVPAKYREPHWLVVRRTSQADSLYDHVQEGRVRYVMVRGVHLRIVALHSLSKTHKSVDRFLAQVGIDADSIRVFVVAVAYEATAYSEPTGDETLTPQFIASCSANATMPVLVGESGRTSLIATLKSGTSPTQLHAWGYGWNDREAVFDA
jgi:hypothetical protein